MSSEVASGHTVFETTQVYTPISSGSCTSVIVSSDVVAPLYCPSTSVTIDPSLNHCISEGLSTGSHTDHDITAPGAEC